MIQVDFAKAIGEIDLTNLTDDFIEDVMLQSKPLQSILHAIRKRQRVQSLKKRIKFRTTVQGDTSG